jgi:hypothetical protein
MRIRDPGWKKFGSGIRDGKKSDPGSGINIPDPQHCKITPSIFSKFKFCVEARKSLLHLSLYGSDVDTKSFEVRV